MTFEEALKNVEKDCMKCYPKDGDCIDCEVPFVKEALEKQIPKKTKDEDITEDYNAWICGKCGRQHINDYLLEYCSNCGQKVKYKGRRRKG